MPLVSALPAALAALFLFVVPGFIVLALLPQEDRDALGADEALFLAGATSVLVSAWLGLVLAEAGRFSLVLAGAILAAASLVAAAAFRRRLRWPLRAPERWGALLPAVAVLALALVLEARPSEYIVGGRDPGAYVAAMGLIGRTGGIVYTDPGVLSIPKEDLPLFYGTPGKGPFAGARFMGFDLESPGTGRVVPQFFHLFPAFGAYLFQAMGVKGALATPPVFAILGTLGGFFTLRRLLGPAPALLASLLLGSNVVQVWFARYPVSETVSQFLVFLGLLAFLHWEERGSVAFGVLAGAAFGVSLLVRIDSVLIAVPLGIWLAIRLGDGSLSWRRSLGLVVPFALLAMHSALHAAVFTRKYLLDITSRPYWHHPPMVWAGGAVAAAVAIAAAPRLGPVAVRWLEARGDSLRAIVAAALVATALYAYFVRPQLSVWAGGDGNDPVLAWESPGALKALGFHRLAAHDAQSLARLGWFVTPGGLALGVLGLVVMIREWRPRYLMPVLTALTFSLFYLYKIRVYNDYYFALRRYVPVTIPFLMASIALLLVRFGSRGGWRRTAAAGVALILFTAFARDTARVWRHVDWQGSVKFVADVARRFGPEDVVVFEQPRSIHLLSLPLWAHFGVNALELARFNPDPDRLSHLVQAWRGRYRHIYFVHTYRTNLCGMFLERVQDYPFGTFEWERSYGGPPRGPEPRGLHFTISRVVPPEELKVPPLPEVDVGGSDDFQVSGFFDKEGGEELTFRWTGSCASVYVPGAKPGARLVVRTGIGKRPPTPPVVVKVSLSGHELGRFEATPGWREDAFTLPAALPPGPPLVRLDVPAFRPSNVWRGDPDTRELGVMVDWIRVVP